MSALLRLTATETRLFFREPMIVFFALGFPPLLLVIFGAIPAFREPDADLGGLRTIDVYVPIIVALGLAMFALNSLCQLLATYREKGVLRRMRTTPVRPEAMLGAQLLMSTALSVVTMLVALAVGRLAFGVRLPRHVPAYLTSYVLAAVTMFAIGLLVAALAPSGKSAGAVGTVLFFPVVFFAGLWLPRDSMPGVLRAISDVTPLGAGVQSLQDATAGQWPQMLPVAVMLGWTIVAGGLAARYFRWE
ncbi:MULTISPECIES: ABC transporter permease [unclassified Micromonospora]|uniref:ABC transporter permease n=1 Tax=unclassified Micromonospora TaxID=2617518 RepID=UPI001B38EBC9|nr:MULTISPECIES: ABC transporter permease [unclassified Micromonospora]MBQ1044379.1 ABC transporter permease [Micromonospora sp. C72]MBQ1056883.1 ABC transporter permease [Micromonospora sp. C32]